MHTSREGTIRRTQDQARQRTKTTTGDRKQMTAQQSTPRMSANLDPQIPLTLLVAPMDDMDAPVKSIPVSQAFLTKLDRMDEEGQNRILATIW